MRFNYATPPAFPAISASSEIEAAIAREAQQLIHDATSGAPITTLLDAAARHSLFVPAMARLCGDARVLHVPVERVIVLIKRAWHTLADVRYRLADAAPDVLSTVITVCIEQYFEGL